jgi:hypothetical protein
MLYAICDLPPPPPSWALSADLDNLPDSENSQINSFVKSQGFLVPGEGNKFRPSVATEYIDRVLIDKTNQEKSASVIPKFLDDKELDWARLNISKYANDVSWFLLPLAL